MAPYFEDRRDAGRQLAQTLQEYRPRAGVVLGIPRGGVIVAAEIAHSLGWPLDVIIAHKVGAPMRPELAIGAVAEAGIVRINAEWVRLLGVDDTYLHDEVAHQQAELVRRMARYRDRRSLPALDGRVAIVVDDGVATGYTATAALAAVRALHPAALIFAAPIASREAVETLEEAADRVCCLVVDLIAGAVGAAYKEFAQTSDEEVRAALYGAAAKGAASPRQRNEPLVAHLPTTHS